MMRSILLILSLNLIVTTVSGCSSTAKSGNLDKAVSDYNAASYSQAEQEAVQAMNNSTGTAKEDAAYVAGLSAYRTGNITEAERRFLFASQSSNIKTAGSAKAMLGQVRMDQHRPREAAVYFADASRLLTGEDAKKAAQSASLAYQQAGDPSASRQWSQVSTAIASPSPATDSKGRPAGPTLGFSLQVGAFSDKTRAQRAADEANTVARKDGLGPVRILNRRDDRGKPLYLVQFGFFTSRDAAAAARARIGKLEYIVAPVTGTS
jgi:outer membrane murein-binding lipoprotein Lpp